MLAGHVLAVVIGIGLLVQMYLFEESRRNVTPKKLALTIGLMVLNAAIFVAFLAPGIPDGTIVEILKGA